MAVITDVLFAADSRKVDWKAIHKFACYILVLVSGGTKVQQTMALDGCESGDLNTVKIENFVQGNDSFQDFGGCVLLILLNNLAVPNVEDFDTSLEALKH